MGGACGLGVGGRVLVRVWGGVYRLFDGLKPGTPGPLSRYKQQFCSIGGKLCQNYGCAQYWVSVLEVYYLIDILSYHYFSILCLL